MARKFGKKVEIDLDILKYNIAVIGESGIGKSTLAKKVCEKLAGDDGYIALDVGKEDGHKAIAGIVSESAEDWDKFEEIIDDIVDNKSSAYKDLKIVIIDTIDQLFEIAEPEVIRLHNNTNTDKMVDTINAAFGGFMKGQDKAVEIILDKLWELKSVGVSFFILGHTKKRDIEDVITGQTYSTLTTNISQRYFSAIKTKLDILGVAAIDREIVKEKTGRKNIVTKKDEEKGKIVSESRKITFRDDNYTIDSKSRFANIASEVELNADEFIKALQDAILAEHSKGDKTVEESKKDQALAELKKEKQIAEKNASDKAMKELTKITDEIGEFFKDNKSNMEILKPIIKLSKELGYKNPTVINNVEDAQKVLDLINI